MSVPTAIVLTVSILVFVVEDQEHIQHLLQEGLTDGGFSVSMASTGEEAIAMLDAEGASFSALITDINLPGQLTGWDVAKHARELSETLPVIYMTGASAHEWASKGVPNSQLMPKPFAVAPAFHSNTRSISVS
ncbi:response regulator transcription factor [Lichenifustis flavocetrariae]|uniref:Response regulator n=1 Tax=Lichenifustis flavocetrariae TaxID=2949735 RepID=A0AA41Z2Y6_9HYPH|nr:response regulator [Lichenifustis flavocetrariae]MCW6512022.1 response regulator [Lichenifustis flavocetrariae]